MGANGYLQLGLFLVVLVALTKPLGAYMARIYSAAPKWKGELLLYKAAGIDPAREMRWTEYAIAMLVFNVMGLLAVYALQRFQAVLPLNPAGMGAISADSAFNTAVSFATNTNWQGYGGESTMSYLTQMLALTVQNFVSCAAGMATLVAFIRGFTRRSSPTIGNFWVDMTRSTLYILLPLSVVWALALASQGVPQTFSAYPTVPLVESVEYDKTPTEKATQAEQTIAVGPVASQIAIKQLGTNGGGFFNTNSAHPLENPTPLSNFLQVLAILLIPAALCYTFGVMVGDRRQGWAVFATMTILFVAFLAFCTWAEQSGNPMLAKQGADTAANMEGKEVRVGIVNSALWATATTAASNGSVNAMHDSFTPLGGLVPMWLIQFQEVIFGGAGSGLYGMLVFAIIAVFVAGLMIGRTPEYLGKKIESFEMKMAAITILVTPFVVLVGTAVAVLVDPGKAGIANPGAHGFSEILYAFSSAGNNNGSAFAGLSANTPFYNSMLGFAMLFARYWLAIPTLAIAGALAAKKSIPPGLGTLPTHTPLFVVLLAATVVVVGALTFVPALALGPVVEHLMMVTKQ